MGVSLLLALVLAQPAEPMVAAVEVRLPQRATADESNRAAAAVMIRPGQPYRLRMVRKTIRALYAVGFADVLARASHTDKGVEVIFELDLKVVVSDVYFEGNVALTSDVLKQQVKLTAGSEYWPERAEEVAEGLREYYVQRGYRAAVVTPEVSGGGGKVSVGLTIVENAPLRLKGYVFSGDPGLPMPVLTQAMGLKPGDVLDEQRLREGVAQLKTRLKELAFYRARVDPAVVREDGTVLVPMASGPRYRIVFEGNHGISSAILKAVAGYAGDETLDETLKFRLQAKLEQFYRLRGFYDVQVEVEEALGSDDAAKLVFRVTEGAPLRVARLSFAGNKVVSDGELKDVLRAAVESARPAVSAAHSTGDDLGLEGRSPPLVGVELPSPPLETIFEENAWREAVRGMEVLYRERGYLSAHVSFEGLIVTHHQGVAAFVVREGPRSYFGSLRIAGLPVGFESAAVKAYEQGLPFRLSVIEALSQRLSQELGRNGFLFAKVEASHQADSKGQRVDCLIEVEPGPQVKVQRVLPVGNVRTADRVLMQQSTMVEGRVLDAEALVQTQNNLIALGIFRSVHVELLAPETPDTVKTVLLKVKEAERFTGTVSGGYYVAEGPRVVGEGSLLNLLGAGVNLSGRAVVHYFGWSAPALSKFVVVDDLKDLEPFGFRLNLALQNRGLLPGNVGFRFDAVGERVFRPQFQFTRIAGITTLDWSRSFRVPGIEFSRPKVALALQSEIDWASVLDTRSSSGVQTLPTSLADQERLRFLYGKFLLHTLRLTPTLDFRDSALMPRAGVLLQVTAEWTKALFSEDLQLRGVPVHFMKLSGMVSGYVPVGKWVVLAASARLGRIYPLEAGSVTPPVKRFFMGGANSLRGFNEDQLLAEDVRPQYRQDVRDCAVVALPSGCSAAAQAIGQGRQVPSQGGELFALFKGELRVPVTSSLELAGFVEAGNLYLALPDALHLRKVAGGGVRYVTPVGPLALDVGFNLEPDALINEPLVVVHFNIGVF